MKQILFIIALMFSDSIVAQDDKNISSCNTLDNSSRTEKSSDPTQDDKLPQTSINHRHGFINPCNFTPSPSWCPNISNPTEEKKYP